MYLQKLVYFTEVANQGSINKAAEVLFLTQPNLSRSISSLENELGVQLFNRNNKGVFLTEDGKKLYEYSRVIMNQLEIISRMSPKKSIQMLTVSAYPILLNVHAVSEFYQHNKDIQIKLLENRMEQVVEHVSNAVSEIGIIHFNNRQKKEIQNLLSYKDMEMHIISNGTWYANIGENNPLYQYEEVTMEQLSDYPLVRMPDDYFANLTLHLQVDSVKISDFKTFYLNSHGAIITFIQNTDAFRLGPGWSYHDFAKVGIRTIPIKNMNVEVSCAWIKRKKELLTNEAAQFLQIIKKYYERDYPLKPSKSRT